MDKQAEEIAQIPGAEVKRVGEGINVTFDSGVLFGYDKSVVSQEAVSKLNELSGILTKYPDYHDIRSFLASTYSWDSEYKDARKEFKESWSKKLPPYC